MWVVSPSRPLYQENVDMKRILSLILGTKNMYNESKSAKENGLYVFFVWRNYCNALCRTSFSLMISVIIFLINFFILYILMKFQTYVVSLVSLKWSQMKKMSCKIIKSNIVTFIEIAKKILLNTVVKNTFSYNYNNYWLYIHARTWVDSSWTEIN